MIKGCNSWRSEPTSWGDGWDWKVGLFDKKGFGNSLPQEPVKPNQGTEKVSITKDRKACKAQRGWGLQWFWLGTQTHHGDGKGRKRL